MAAPRRNLLATELTKQLVQHPEKIHSIVKKLIEMGINGDIKALQMLFDRDSGRVKEELEISNPYNELSEADLHKQIAEKFAQLRKIQHTEDTSDEQSYEGKFD